MEVVCQILLLAVEVRFRFPIVVDFFIIDTAEFGRDLLSDNETACVGGALVLRMGALRDRCVPAVGSWRGLGSLWEGLWGGARRLLGGSSGAPLGSGGGRGLGVCVCGGVIGGASFAALRRPRGHHGG